METSNEKGRFPKTSTNYASLLLRVKRTLGIAPSIHNSYISMEFANRLAISNSNIIERLGLWNEKQYEKKYWQLNTGDYTFVLQFIVRSLFCDDNDIILDSPWMEALRSFILNRKKKITLHDIKLDSDPVTS